MKAKPLRERVPAVLQLQPMTVRQMARCLGVTEGGIRNALREISVTKRGTVRTPGRPWIDYVPATLHPQSETQA